MLIKIEDRGKVQLIDIEAYRYCYIDGKKKVCWYRSKS
jgi:hypothetical protein